MMISILLFGLLGACIGSFLAARAFRVINEREIDAWGRSACMSCKKKLEAFDLIPILSFLVFRGRCRRCGENISLLYIIVESLTALLFVFVAYPFSADIFQNYDLLMMMRLIGALGFVSMLLYISIIDIYVQAFPVVGLMILTGIYVVCSMIFGVPLQIGDSVAGMIFFLGVFVLFMVGGKLFFKKEAFGEGDVYLGVFIGSFLGLGNGVVALYGAVFSGALYSLYVLFINKKRKTSIPFAPFLCFGAILAYFFAGTILEWYQNFFLLS